MKFFAVLLVSLTFLSTSLQASEENLAGLESLKWKYRVLIVYAKEPFVDAALENLGDLATEIEERDMVWFLLANNELHTNYQGRLGKKFRKQLQDHHYSADPAETMVILIGKDGGIKSTASDLDFEATFGLIDQMPMRKAEMRNADHKLDQAHSGSDLVLSGHEPELVSPVSGLFINTSLAVVLHHYRYKRQLLADLGYQCKLGVTARADDKAIIR